MKLLNKSIRDIVKLLDEGKTLPDEYRTEIFKDDGKFIKNMRLPLDVFNVRTRKGLLNNNTLTLGDLALLTEKQVLKMPKCGRMVLNELKEFLKPLNIQLNGDDTQIMNSGIKDSDEQLSKLFKKLNMQKINPLELSFAAYWEKVLSGMDTRRKEVILKRYGLGSHKSLTLHEIGEIWNITRERVRQIEDKAEIVISHRTDTEMVEMFFAQRLPSPRQLYDINKLPKDCQFFAAITTNLKAYIKFINSICKIPLKVVNYGEKRYLSFNSQAQFDAICEEMRAIAVEFKNRPWPELEKAIREQYEGDLQELCTPVLNDLKEKISFRKTADGEIICYVSNTQKLTRYRLIVQIIYDSPQPISTRQIQEQAKITIGQTRGSINVISTNRDYGVYPAQHSRWAHIANMGITQENIDEVLALSKHVPQEVSTDSLHARQIIEAGSHALQRLNEYEVAAILRHYSDLRYLGRNLFAIPGSGVETRGRIHDYIVAVLKRVNRPMHYTELIAEVQKSRSIIPNMMINPLPPLKNLGRNIWGLDIEGFGEG